MVVFRITVTQIIFVGSVIFTFIFVEGFVSVATIMSLLI